MSDVGQRGKSMAKYLVAALAPNLDRRSLSVRRFYNEDGPQSVDLFRAEGAPMDHLCSIATVDLGAHDIWQEGAVLPFGVNLVTAAEKCADELSLILATCAFYIEKDCWIIKPGTIFKDVVANFDNIYNVKHMLFVNPFLWDGRIGRFEHSGRVEVFLQAVPITHQEYAFARERGVDALEEALLADAACLFQLDRNSIEI